MYKKQNKKKKNKTKVVVGAYLSRKKDTLAQVFSCEFCKISKNTFSYRILPVDASSELSWFSACEVVDQTMFFQDINRVTIFHHEHLKYFVVGNFFVKCSLQFQVFLFLFEHFKQVFKDFTFSGSEMLVVPLKFHTFCFSFYLFI